MFDDDDKMYVNFTINMYGKTHAFNATLEDAETWTEVLDPIIRTLEAAYGYSFDLDKEDLGIYYPGKKND